MSKRIRSADHHEWAARDGGRAVLAALLMVFVIATSLSDGKLIPDFAFGGKPRPVPAKQHDDDLRNGSILIAPAEGNICEHRLIDNATWQIRANGTVRCDAAVEWLPGRGDTYTPTTRIEAIRDGFVAKR